MQQAYRTSRLRNFQPQSDETIIRSREQAVQVLTNLESQLKGKLSKNDRAVKLKARATLYHALGDPKMLEASEDSYYFSRTAQTTDTLAIAYHWHGRMAECFKFHKDAYHLPHEPGWEIDIGYAFTLYMQGRWLEAWDILRTTKKRMVYAAGLPEWKGELVRQVGIIPEGGVGDHIHYAQYFPLLQERGIEPVVYLHNTYFTNGFANLLKSQPWFKGRILPSERISNVSTHPFVGLFDFPVVFRTTPTTLPNFLLWNRHSSPDTQNLSALRTNRPRVGFCWHAQSLETPFLADGSYRALTNEQARRIKESVPNVEWISLQHKASDNLGCYVPAPHETWEDTAAIIDKLDLVVTVDTGIMHLAASMGKPTWVLLSGAMDWKFGLNSPSCPWYPTTRLFRNQAFGFDSAVENIIAALREI